MPQYLPDRVPQMDLALPLCEWACLHAELVWIYEGEVAPRNRLKKAAVERPGYWIWYMRRGTVRVSTERRRWEAGPGEWMMRPSGTIRQEFSDDARILSVHFFCQWPSGENLLTSPEALVIPGKKEPQLERKAHRLERLAQRYLSAANTHYARHVSGYEIFLSLHSKFLEWLSLWFRVRMAHGSALTRLGRGDDRILRAVRCLNMAPLDGGFPREKLAEEIRLGEAHLNRLFLRAFGLTARRYWEQRRLEFAKSCLRTSTMLVKEVAYRLGFRSDSHFVIWFRQHTGKCPSDWRRLETMLSQT